MIDDLKLEQLRKDLQQQVKSLERNLRPLAEASQTIQDEWQRAKDSRRIAADFEVWLPSRVTQIAVAWVLATVFVRFCEDNGLISLPFLSGPGERAAQARERQQHFYVQRPEAGDFEWLEAAVQEMEKSPVVAGLFTRDRNPMWMARPEPQVLQDLIGFWRRTGGDGEVVYDFTDSEWDTRFLGDLYQSLSEDARKRYALLQTPEFVERYILKYTLDKAIEEFGLEPELSTFAPQDLPRQLRVIDPACGSGHFLLGAFDRILKAWQAEDPNADRAVLVNRALDSVHGVDKNPFAVEIARFRLLLAAMRAAGVTRLDERVDLHRLNIAVGDSLMHGAGAPGRGEFDFEFHTEDVNDFMAAPTRILHSGSYHVVVGNPPYITPKDPQERENYRKYNSCSGKYALSVPFAERMFQLALRGLPNVGTGSGFVGQITTNSFMKREFGKKLIEEYFQTIDLTHVIDTSGAFIPDHGTPTVILIGRRRDARRAPTVRAVLGKRGEPFEPEVAEEGLVWKAIEDQTDKPGSESEWVSATDAPRSSFAKYPWSLSGGGSDKVMETIEAVPGRLRQRLEGQIGFASFPGQDEAFFLGSRWMRRNGVEAPLARPLIVGEIVRDWSLSDDEKALVPFDENQQMVPYDISQRWGKHLWVLRRTLESTMGFAGKTREESGESWWIWYRWVPERYLTPLSITFAFVATHNHFVLDRGGKVFNRSAPVIKLPEGATEQEHLALLGVLNSSTACFWLKQVSFDKGNRGGQRSTARYAWERFYEFTGQKLESFPLPGKLPLELARELDSLAQRLTALSPAAVCRNGLPTREILNEASVEYEQIRARMILLQEELDWDVYYRYGLLTDEEASVVIVSTDVIPGLGLGERAFEFLLAERLDGAQGEKQWFERHHSSPAQAIPEDWPQEYQNVVRNRIRLIRENPYIELLERPEYKRRWEWDSWGDLEKVALRNWLLDRCEARELWFGTDGQPRALTIDLLADALRTDAGVVAVARLYADDAEADLADVLEPILRDQHVPYRAKLRYKGEGLIKRAIWERVWDQQREEDAREEAGDERMLDIDPPPKYTGADFRKPSYWKRRGKLDVPKERFISYPDAALDKNKKSLPLGWAGWDHREQAYALITLIEDRETAANWESERIRPLVEGLAEAMPWVRQWHTEEDESGQSPAAAYDAYLAEKRGKHGDTE